ncbi:hypothetical protein H6G72_03485 [Planktothricoides sp. FACHB-1370]|uniref:Uncharacterized protein n=2 Tax=Planktothricoides raciborskii TaxID=132608 RepID=A0AAU8JA70_9CYAN|nr:hypothetical protein AM228_16410 [Planktothricoides sp. SR001]MBD2542934.1 hypothetical protein [Planktothricoides raciborskii FACHB-1370]
MRSPDSGNCCLEGIWETIDELLTPSWDIILHNFIPQVISVSRKQTVNTSLSSLFPENSVYQRQSLWQTDRRYLRNIIDRVDRIMDRSRLYSE